jgi:hypothetical protein
VDMHHRLRALNLTMLNHQALKPKCSINSSML